MKREGVKADIGTDLAAAGMAFLTRGGWIAAPLLWVQKKVVNWLTEKADDAHSRCLVDPIVPKAKDNKSGNL